MCSHCGWDEDSDDDSDALIADGAEAARDIQWALEHRGQMPESEAA